MDINSYSKEMIKSRVFRLATTYWNIQNVDGLDPLVKLLLESVAEEIYTVADNVNTMESRILEKLANILTPDLLVAPSPAHAIIHSRPVDPSCLIDQTCSMNYENAAYTKRYKLENLSFSPVCRSALHNGDVRFLVINGLLYKYDKQLKKQLVARSPHPYTDSGKAWIALELDDEITSLKDISFYIDLPNTPDKKEYLYMLTYTEWKLDDAKIKMNRGIFSQTDFEDTPDIRSPFFKYEISKRVENNVMEIYQNNFLHISSDLQINAELKHATPEPITRLFGTSVQAESSPMLWISIDFPANFTEYVLNDLVVHINAFPIANKTKRILSIKVEDFLGIIPLTTGINEHFLSVESVRDAENKSYHEISCQDRNEDQTYTYSLRKGGCERFDSRDAQDYLIRLSDLLSDESAAFIYKSRDTMKNIAIKMEELIVQMKQYTSDFYANRELLNYLLIDNANEKDAFEIEYWITNCELANNLRAGMILTPHSTSLFHPHSVVLLSTTQGGKKEPEPEEKLQLYKYVLTTGDRIVTMDDIKNFCRMQLGEMMAGVEVKKGVAVSDRPKEGLIRTIDVHITLKPHLKDISEFGSMRDDIKSKLIKKSPDTYNYRVFII